MKRGLVLLAALALLVVSAQDAEARRSRVARIHRGKIILLKKRAPSRFRSDARFLAFLRRYKKRQHWPVDRRKQTKWKLEFFAFFKRRHRDVEVKVKYFDITEGRQFVAGDSIYLSKRGQPILASSLILPRPPFRMNRKYAMYITNARNNVLASTTFWLRGRRERYSGKVTFSDKDTRGK